MNFSYVNLNDVFRLDSNYFQKIFLNSEALIQSIKFHSLNATKTELKSFGAYSLNNDVHYLDEGVPFIRGVNMKGGRITFADMIYIDEAVNGLLWKSEVRPEMVLLSMSGTIGNVAIASKHWKYPMNSNQDIAKIETRGDVNPYFLYAFLASKFGQHFLKREARGSVQQHVFLSQIEQLKIPIFANSFNDKIQNCVEESDRLKSRAEKLYEHSETLILETLSLTKFKPSTEAVNIKSFKDSFGTTGRLDAEYYQSKYEQMMARIAASSHAKLGELVDIKKSIEPGSDAYADDDEGLPFLRVADYSKQGITSPQVRLNKKFVVENSDKIAELKPKQDTILFSKDGSVGEAYRLRENADLITSGAILHLTVRDKTRVLPDYLTLVLNSIVVKQQAERDAGGSIILHWRKEEIENVLVPILDMSIQQKIASQVQESFKLKAESERLLEVAKRAVEIAIEENEETALEYIDSMS